MTDLTIERDLAVGIPVDAPQPTNEERYFAWLRTGAPFGFHGRGPQPPMWEEERWIESFRRLGADIDCRHGSFCYRLPDGWAPEGEIGALLEWVGAAEGRIPGVRRRIYEVATNLAGIQRAFSEYDARQAQKARAAA